MKDNEGKEGTQVELSSQVLGDVLPRVMLARGMLAVSTAMEDV